MNETEGLDLEQLIQPNATTITFTLIFIVVSVAIGLYAARKAKTAE